MSFSQVRSALPAITRTASPSPRRSSSTTKFENMGAQMVREVASKSADAPRRRTHHRNVLAAAIVREAPSRYAAGMNPMDLKRGIDLAVEAVVADLVKNSKRSPRTRRSPRSAPFRPTATPRSA